MANIQQKKSEALAIIDAALAILNKYPNIETTNTALSFNTSTNPFPFLMDCFKSSAGYNILINILSKFIMTGLPAVEIAVKGVLLSNIKNILSCSINPFISEDILRDGIVFELPQIDISDTLRYSPLDEKVGKYYYFDNFNENEELDEVTNKYVKKLIPKQIDELKYTRDFNCLIWYMKNIASFREVWGQKKDENGNISNNIEGSKTYWNNEKNKCRKDAGIVTLEFNERVQGLRNSEGNGMSIQTPYSNCLHVFIGNVKEKNDTEINATQQNFIENANNFSILRNEIEKIENEIKYYEKEKEDCKLARKKNKITQEKYEENIQDFNLKINGLKKQLTEKDKEGQSLKKEKEEVIKKLRQIHTKLEKDNYRSIKENYYYKHTLAEFNTDYVMSLRLFDSKVVAAQLLDSLMGLLTINLDLTYKQQLIKNEIKKMVQMVVETDDSVVDDCFFTFSNEDYNAMLEKAELNKSKLFSINGEQNMDFTIDAESILESLNEINEDAIRSGNTTVIEHALTEISKTLSTPNYEETEKLNFGVQMNFIENLMNNLAYVIASSVLSPKVYLLILINLEILGRDTNFNLEGFIGQFKQLIVSLIRSIRDQLLEYLVNELMKILGNIATEIAVKIGIEQAQYYTRLIRKIIDCFKRKGTRLDFDVDNVDHADIISEELTEPKNNNC